MEGEAYRSIKMNKSTRTISKLNAANRITDKHERAYAEQVKLFATPKLSQDTLNARSSRILGRIPSVTADAIMEAAARVKEHLTTWIKEFAA
jgi:hypothetical protein